MARRAIVGMSKHDIDGIHHDISEDAAMVINVNPNQGVSLPAGTIPGWMYVYCVNTTAVFGISIGNQPPPYVWHQLMAGHMLTFQVDRFAVWVFNSGPSRIQLLSPSDLHFEGEPIDKVQGAIQIGRAETHAGEHFINRHDNPKTGARTMNAQEKLARSETTQLAIWLAPFHPSRSLMMAPSRVLAEDESVDQGVGNDFASDGSGLPELGPLSSLGSWPNVAAVLDRKALSISGFNPASTKFDEVAWEVYLAKFSTLPFFTSTSSSNRLSQISSLSLALAVSAIMDLVENIVAGPKVDTIIKSVKKIAELAMTNQEKSQKDNYQKQGLISIKDSKLTMGFLKCDVEMKFVEGKGYQQLTQSLNIFQFYGYLDFEKCKRSSHQILAWDKTDVDAWEKGTGSYAITPNESPAWNA